MIDKKVAKFILDKCLSTGADFAEIFAEDRSDNAMQSANGLITECVSNRIFGAGIRILKGLEEVYGFTNDISKKSLESLTDSLIASYNAKPLDIQFELKDVRVKKRHKVLIDPIDCDPNIKAKYLAEFYEGAKEVSPEIVQIMCVINSSRQKVEIFNTLGKVVKDTRYYVRAAVQVVASDGKEMQTGSETYGRHAGLEIFDNIDLRAFSREIANTAVRMLHADEMVGQTLPVVINNAFGGVILHEACVHSLEATSVAKGMSIFCGKLGEKIANEVVTAIDDGTLTNNWGSLNVDDEGNPTQKNVLIENGILKSYLFDYRNTRRLAHPLTGSGRRESYKFSPTSRMNNTFIAPGKSKFDDIIASIKFGLFAKKMGGGSVNPASGEYNFAVSEAYLIRDGKIAEPVRGATLVGTGRDTLLKIDMVSDNLAYGQGVCGSLSGSVPTDVGQPTIRISSMTVGGKGGK